MKDKFKLAITFFMISFICTSLVLLINKIIQPTETVGNKEVRIIVLDRRDEVKTLFDEVVKTDGLYVYDVLMENKDQLNLKVSDGPYGKQLDGLCGLENTSDWSICWQYIINNNYPLAIDQTAINDKDTLTFYYSSDFTTQWWK